MSILRGSRYESAIVERVAGRPVKTPFTLLDEVIYLRGRRRQRDRVPVPGDRLPTRFKFPTIFPLRRPGTTITTRVVSFEDYVVQQDDRMQDLAFQRYGDANKWHLIADANPEVFDPDVLTAGSIIKLPTLQSIRRNAKPLLRKPRPLPRPFSGLR